jgi:hypothetical protein
MLKNETEGFSPEKNWINPKSLLEYQKYILVLRVGGQFYKLVSGVIIWTMLKKAQILSCLNIIL